MGPESATKRSAELSPDPAGKEKWWRRKKLITGAIIHLPLG